MNGEVLELVVWAAYGADGAEFVADFAGDFEAADDFDTDTEAASASACGSVVAFIPRMQPGLTASPSPPPEALHRDPCPRHPPEAPVIKPAQKGARGESKAKAIWVSHLEVMPLPPVVLHSSQHHDNQFPSSVSVEFLLIWQKPHTTGAASRPICSPKFARSSRENSVAEILIQSLGR